MVCPLLFRVILGVLHDITTLDVGAVHHSLVEDLIPLRFLELVDSDSFQGALLIDLCQSPMVCPAGNLVHHERSLRNLIVMKKTIYSPVILLILSGCAPIPTTGEILATMYNVPSTSKSAFDNTTQIRVDNIFCGNITFNVIQNTNQKAEGVVLLQANLSYAQNIRKDNSLKFNIDGEYFEFSSHDQITQIEETPNLQYDQLDKNAPIYNEIVTYHNKSTKTYMVAESFINKLATAEKVIPRLYTLGDTYIDGYCMRTEERKAAAEAVGGDVYSGLNSQEGFKKFIEMSNAMSTP